MKRGWIKLHRKSIESMVFGNEKCWKIWCWCLMRAGHKENTFLLGRKKITLGPSQFIMGLKKAKDEIDLAFSTIHYWLSFLEKEGMVELKKTNKYTVVTILNWGTYQEVELQKNSNDNANGTLKETNKNDKNDKNISSDKSEVEYIPLKEDIKKMAEIWDSDKYIEGLVNAQREDLKIVGHYFKHKKRKFPTLKAARAEFGRNIKSAGEIAEYPKAERTRAVNLAAKSTPQWTLLTVCKYLNK